MTNGKTPQIKACKTAQYEFKQSRYEHVPKLPMRCMLLGSSGSGKTTLISSMVLDIYRNCFQRIYVFSHSVNVDSIWEAIKEYVDKNLKPDKHEVCFFEEYNPEALHKIIENQKKIIQYQKDHKMKTLFNILIILDDMADDANFVRRSTLLHSLYIRCRHIGISTITSTQVFKAISPIVRKNLTDIMVWRLRNEGDLQALLEEISAYYDKKTTIQIYRTATDIPYNFLYLNLCARDKEDVFWSGFNVRLIPSQVSD